MADPFRQCHRDFRAQAIPGWCWAFAGWKTSAPSPGARVAKPNFTSHVSGNHFLAPGDFATIYKSNRFPAGLDGTGQKIAVVGQTEIDFCDIDAFRSAAGLPARTRQLSAGSRWTAHRVSTTETKLKPTSIVEWSGGVARKATILYVYAGANSTTKNVFDALQFAIDKNLAPVISISYGNCEANLTGFVRPCSGGAAGQRARADHHCRLGRLRSGRLRSRHCQYGDARTGSGCARQRSRGHRHRRHRVHRRRSRQYDRDRSQYDCGRY